MIAMRSAAAEESRDGSAGSASVLGLRIPAEAGQPVTLAVPPLTASALSDAIGGGLLEDVSVPRFVVDSAVRSGLRVQGAEGDR